MENKITFLGTGGGRVVIANQARATGGFVINIADHQIHVDPGPGALTKAREFRLNTGRTDTVFVSHAHIDHANDVNAIIEAMTLGGVHKRGTLISVPSVIKGANREVAWLHNFHRNALDNCFTVKAGDVVKIGELSFKMTATKHDEPFGVGFILEMPNLTIGYTGDTTYSGELWRTFKGVKVLIINVLRPGKDRWKTHMCTDDAIRLIDKIHPELAIIQHFGMKMVKANPLYEARRIQTKTGVRTVAATDGLVVSLGGL